MNRAVNQLKEILDKFEIKYNLSENSLSFISDKPDRFNIELIEDPEEITIFFAGWHQHFSKNNLTEETEKEITNLFLFGLSEKCRLKVFGRGERDYKWIVELWDGNAWIFDGFLTTFSLAFWKRVTKRYLQNALLKTSDIEDLFPLKTVKINLIGNLSLRCQNCKKLIPQLIFDLENTKILCGQCNNPTDSDKVLNNANVNDLARFIPPQKRDLFLTKLGFKKKPVIRSSKLMLGIGVIMGLFLIVSSFIFPVGGVGKRLLFLGMGTFFIFSLRHHYNNEKTPRWGK
jgi:hypothetical protein